MKRVFLIISLCLAGWIVAVLVLVGIYTYMGRLARAPLSKPPEHGIAFLVEADFSQMPGDTNMASLEKALNMVLLERALENRFSNIGTRAFIEPVSASQLRISLPVMESNEVEYVREAITHRGFLEFRLVNDDSYEIIRNNEPIPPGYEMLRSLEMEPGQAAPENLIVKKKAEDGLAGNFIKSARVVTGSMGGPQIDFTLTDEARIAFAHVTTEYGPNPQTGQRHRLAIILDGELYSAPMIMEPIENGECQITGHFTDQEAGQLAQILNSPLPAALNILETNSY
jgi:preprotein translocase subunit SecD